MTGGKDDYYRPWLDRIDDEHSGAAAPEAEAGTNPPPPPADPAAAPDGGARNRANQALSGLKRGWSAFAAATIRWGERADVPRRIAALELGDKSAKAGGAISRAARKAGGATAAGARAAGKRGATIAGQVGSSAGTTAKSVGSATRTRVRQGFEGSLAATRAGGARLADGAKQAARPVIARVAPPKPEAPVVGNALDRLVASEDDAAATAAKPRSSAGDLPLFGTLPALPETEPPVVAPDPQASPAEPRDTADVKVRRAARAAPGTDPDSTASADSDRAAHDPRAFRPNRAVIGALAVGALIVAIFAGSAFWGRDTVPPGNDAATDSVPSEGPTAADMTAAADVDPAERAEIEAVVEAYILDHPDIIPRALERLQQRESARAIARLRPAIERPFAGAWAGNAKGDVVVTEYSDFACTFCRRSLPDVERLIKTDPNVKIVYRELPILSAQSSPAAKVALAAARKGRYRAYHLALFALGQPSEANILAAAAKAGMTPQDVAAAKADPALDREIASNVSVAQQLRFEGTPSFVVGDTILHGAVGFEALQAAVAKARKDD